MNIRNKTIVLTGATGGMGKELARRLDENGANLVLISKTETELKRLLNSLKGDAHSYYVCDLADLSATDSLALEISQKYETIDVFLGVAGIGIYKPIEELGIDEWNSSLNINLTSNFIFIKKLQKKLENSPTPLVMVVGSGMGVIPTAGRSAYCASKFGLRGMVLSLSEEFKRTKLKFCLITLGSTLTGFGPMSLEEKQNDALNGKAYFTVEWVGKKLTQIITDDARDIEYTLYPSDYGFGT